jgi:hypothetical protein
MLARGHPRNLYARYLMTTQGWYQDPRFPGLLRWWDGDRWTDHTQPAAGVLPVPQPQPFVQQQSFVQPQPFGQPPPMWPAADPGRDLAEADKAGRAASRFLVAGAGAYVLQFIAGSLALGSTMHDIRTWIHEPRLADGSLPPLKIQGGATYNAISDLGAVVLLIVGILFLIWFNKAALMAVKLGLPARRSPGWAVGGFFVPIVNFWFPYRSALDLFPPGHPARSAVGRWWALWLTVQLGGIALGAVAWFSEGAAVGVGVVLSAAAIGAAVSLRSLIGAVTRCHAELIARQY